MLLPRGSPPGRVALFMRGMDAPARIAWIGLLLLTATGCTRRYFVNPAHPPRAFASPDAAVPALTNDREPTFIRASAIRRQEGVDPTGLLAVRARDARNFLRTMGWIPTAIGAICGTVALSFLPADGGGDEDMIPFIFAVEAITHLAIGVPFLVVGYTSTGAEVDGPTPGMPLRLGDP